MVPSKGLVGWFFFAGDEENGDVFGVGVVPEGGEQVEAGTMGHGHVADNEVGGLVAGDFDGASGGGRLGDAVVCVFEGGAHGGAQRGIVGD